VKDSAPSSGRSSSARTLVLTSVTMIAFAANPLLCRMAMGAAEIDPASFATVRVASGALVLVLIVAARWLTSGRPRADWRAVVMLFAYMILFAFAYLSLSVGTGALILFGAVLLTMFGVALARGERFSSWSWVGLFAACLGLVYLVAPGVAAPDPAGATLMAGAGVAWGFYSLLGRNAVDPLGDTANNFLLSVPLALVVSLCGACRRLGRGRLGAWLCSLVRRPGGADRNAGRHGAAVGPRHCRVRGCAVPVGADHATTSGFLGRSARRYCARARAAKRRTGHLLSGGSARRGHQPEV